MDKKYTAQETAALVLKKAEEMLKSSKLASMPRPNLTKAGEMENDEEMAMSEKDQTPPDHVEKDPTPEHQPVERNGNPPWGTEPGHYKLARFMGHRDARRKHKPQDVK